MYYATAKEMEHLDALAVENGLEIRQMMELAGWHMLEVFQKLKISHEARIVVVCGKGNKGGDGLAAARHLINHGWNVTVILLDEDVSQDAAHHIHLLERMEADIIQYPGNKEQAEEKILKSDVLIDALIGYHLQGAPRGVFAEIIEVMNSSEKKIIAYDLPSGVDATTGECSQPCIRALATLSLAMPKKLFDTEQGQDISGQIFVADIGIPAFLYDQIALNSRPVFEGPLFLL